MMPRNNFFFKKTALFFIKVSTNLNQKLIHVIHIHTPTDATYTYSTKFGQDIHFVYSDATNHALGVYKHIRPNLPLLNCFLCWFEKSQRNLKQVPQIFPQYQFSCVFCGLVDFQFVF